MNRRTSRSAAPSRRQLATAIVAFVLLAIPHVAFAATYPGA
jgi:hypothetical protein